MCCNVREDNLSFQRGVCSDTDDWSFGSDELTVFVYEYTCVYIYVCVRVHVENRTSYEKALMCMCACVCEKYGVATVSKID